MRKSGVPLVLAGAIASLAVAVAVFLGLTYDWRLGPIRLRITDPVRPLAVAAMFASASLLTARTRAVGVVALLVSGVLGLVVYARTADGAFAPAGDIALIETYTINATSGQLFVGPYSRFGWNHPGPLYFFLLAPFYVMSEQRSAGLSAGALVINLSALAVLIWVCVGNTVRGTLAVAIALMSVLFTWQAAEMLASQWNPHVLVLPTMAIVVLSAAVAAGRIGLLAVVAAFASFVVQTHLGLGPTVFAVGAAATGVALIAAHRSRHDESPRRVWPALNATLWVMFLLWLLPIVEELYQPDGNLSRLWAFFALEPTPGQPFRTAFRVWADMVSAFARMDIHVGWGTRLRVTTSPWSQAWAIVETLAVVGIMVRALVTGDRFRAAIALMLLIASGTGLWSIMRIEDDLYDHLVFWLTAIGALNIGLILDAVVEVALRGRWTITRRQSAVACLLLWILAVAAGFQQLRVVVSRSFRPGLEQLASRRLADVLAPEFEGRRIGRPLVKIDQPIWSVTAGVLLQLQKQHIPIAVEEGWWFMFGQPARPTGHETATLIFAGPELRVRLQGQPGHELLAERDRIAVFLVAGQP